MVCFADEDGRWLIDPLKQTDIGLIVTGNRLIGDLMVLRDYASDFLNMINYSCQNENLHEVGVQKFVVSICFRRRLKLRESGYNQPYFLLTYIFVSPNSHQVL